MSADPKALDAIDAVLTKWNIPTRAGMVARDILAALAQRSGPETLACARVSRREHHESHGWNVGNDDTPGTEFVICPGWRE